MELKRIVNYKFCSFIAVLLFFNVLLFAKENLKSGTSSKIYDEMVKNSCMYMDETSSVKQAAVEGYKKYIRDMNINTEELPEETKTAIKNARVMLLENAEYIDNYNHFIEEKLQNCEQQLKLSIFREKKSFEYLNLLKTREDLKNVKNSGIKLSNGIWLTHLLEFKFIFVVLLIIALRTICSFFSEQKNGLVYMVYAAKDGRMKLFCRRLFILFTVAVIGSFLLYITTAVASIAIHGGAEGVMDLVCSDSNYLLSGHGMNRIQYVCAVALLSGTAVFALALTAWFMMSFFSNISTGILLFALLYGVEYVLYIFISGKSIFRFVKYVNIAALSEIGTAFANYQNWGYSWWIAEVYETYIAIALIAVAVMSCLCCYRNVIRHICRRETKIEKLFLWIQKQSMRALEKAPVWIKEIYKLLFSQKIMAGLAILMVLAIRMDIGNPVTYSMEMTYYKTFFEKAQGLQYGDELQKVLSEYEDDYKTYAQSLSETDPDDAKKLSARKNMLNYIAERVNYVKDKNEAGIHAVIIRPYEYEWAFGIRQKDNQLFLALLCLTATVLLCSTFYSYENKNGMQLLIHTSAMREGWRNKKYIAIFFLIAVFTIGIYGSYYWRLFHVYKIQDIGFGAQSIEMLSKLPINISFAGFLFLDILVKILFFIAVAVIVSTLTAGLSYINSIVTGLIILLPQLLHMLGMPNAEKWSLGYYSATFPAWYEGRSLWIYIFIAGLVITGTGFYMKKGGKI